MKKLFVSFLVLGLVAVSGCMSDPVLRSRFNNPDGAYGAGYVAVAPGSWRNLQHADATCGGTALDYSRQDVLTISASVIRMPYDIVVDVLCFPYDVYKLCRIDWREDVKDY